MISLSFQNIINGFLYGYSTISHRVPDLSLLDDWQTNGKELPLKICNYISGCPSKRGITVLLSGGVDSTFMLIMALNCYHSNDINAVTVGFQDAAYDESEAAARICERLGVKHHIVALDDNSYRDILDKVNPNTYDSWFYSSSLIPTYFAVKKAKEFDNVILTGDGGDELFYGYDRYLLWGWMQKPFFYFPFFKKETRKGRKYREALAYGYPGLVSIWPRAHLKKLLSLKYLPTIDILTPYGEPELPRELMRFDIQTELFGVEFHKVQTARKMAGVVADWLISPFMKDTILRYCYNLPLNLKYRKRIRKWLLRKEIEKILPDYNEIASKRKRGFAAPISKWMSGLEGYNFKLENEMFDNSFIEKLRIQNAKGQEYGEQLWSILIWKELERKGALKIE